MPEPAREEPLDGHSRYQKVKDLNRGTFGFVQLAYDKQTGQYIAIKFVGRGEKVTKYVAREILNHRRLHHPHIIQLRDVFLTPKYLGIAMEYAPGGDLYQYILQRKGLLESDARWFFQQLVIAVEYCHRMGVANRDIKLENALLDDSPRQLLKLCDFGYSKHEKFQSAPGSRVGTPAYLAPEIILTSKGKVYDAKCADVWACGVVLYVLLVGQYPFRRPEDEALKPSRKLHVMLQRILEVQYEIPGEVQVSDRCRDLLSRLFVHNPADRLSLRGILTHPWFGEGLPEGVANMNDALVPADIDVEETYFEGQQSFDEIKRIVAEAQVALRRSTYEHDVSLDIDGYDMYLDASMM